MPAVAVQDESDVYSDVKYCQICAADTEGRATSCAECGMILCGEHDIRGNPPTEPRCPKHQR